MADLIDLTGKRFGRLTVIEKMPPRYKNKTAAFWRCKCDCGRETIVIGRSLRVGLTKSCGCIQSEMMSNTINDLSGKRYGDNVTVIRRADFDCVAKSSGRSRPLWECLTDGGETIFLTSDHLRNMKHFHEHIYYTSYRKFFEEYGMSEDDMKKNTPYSSKLVLMRCKFCGEEYYKKPGVVIESGFGCSCKDHISYIEKFVFKFLKIFNIEFEYQKSFVWSGKKRYDFYCKNLNLIIEPGGRQHEVGWGKKQTAECIKENDLKKKEMAYKNGIKHYFFFISNSTATDIIFTLKQSVDDFGNSLLSLLNIKDEDITEETIMMCNDYGETNIAHRAREMRVTGLSYDKIAKELGVTGTTVRGWCSRLNLQTPEITKLVDGQWVKDESVKEDWLKYYSIIK